MSPPAPMDCQDLVELVTAYLEDGLTPADRMRFEAHLAECEGCEAYVGQIRITVALSSRTVDDVLEPQMREELLEVFRAWKRS